METSEIPGLVETSRVPEENPLAPPASAYAEEQPVVSVTGHRPNRISDEERVREDMLTALYALRPSLLLQGMADGVDLWAAAAAWKAGVPFHAVQPWAGHRAGTMVARDWVLDKADEVIILNDSLTYPGPSAYHVRNRWMVDNSSILLAVWDGKKSGGTYQTVKYAEGKGQEIVRIRP